MLALAKSSVRARRLQLSGAILVIGLAALIVSISLNLMLSAALAAPASGRFAATAAVVYGAEHPADAATDAGPLIREPAPLPMDLARELRAIDHVTAVIPDRSFYAQVLDRSGDPVDHAELLTIGHPWSSAALAPYDLTKGTAPISTGEVVLDTDLAMALHARVGGSVQVVTERGVGAWRVSGIATTAPRSSVTHSAVFFSDYEARRLYSRGGSVADAFGVVAESGYEDEVATRVRERIADRHLDVLTGRQRGRAEPHTARPDYAPLVEFLGTALVLAGCVAGVIVAGTFGFMVAARRRELSVLRAVAATPAQVRRMVLGEGLLVALSGALVGAPASVLASHPIASALSLHGVAPPQFRPLAPLAPVVGALGGAAAVVVVGLIACWAAARTAARVSPVEALREADGPVVAVRRWRGALGVLALVGALSAPFWTAVAGETLAMFTPVVLVLLVVGLALVGPAVFGWPARAVTALLVRNRAYALLVQAYCRAAPARVAATGLPVMLLVGLVGGFLLIQSSFGAAISEQSARRDIADLVVLPDRAPGLPSAVAALVGGVPGVGVTVPVMATTVFGEVLGEEEARPALGVGGSGVSRVFDLDVTAGRLDHVDRGAVAVSDQQARSRGWQVGDLVSLRMNDGEVERVRVAATFRRSLGFADYLLSSSDALAHTGDRLDAAVYVGLAPGASAPAVRSRVSRALSGQPTASVATAGAGAEVAEDGRAVNDWAALALAGLVGAFVVVAAANSVVASVVHRAGELKDLRLVGATRRQVLRLVVVEAGVLALAGLAVAFTAALLPTLWMVHASLGGSVAGALDADTVLALATIALASAAIPAWAAAQLVVRRSVT